MTPQPRQQEGSSAEKRILDIEDALVWACDEQAKTKGDETWSQRAARTQHHCAGQGVLPAVAPMFRWAVPGGRSSVTEGDPHPDAMTIWRTVQRLEGHRYVDGQLVDIGLPADAPAALMHGLWAGLDAAAAWARARETAIGLALVHARMRSRPDVPDLPAPAGPILGSDHGRPVVLAPGTVRVYGARRRGGAPEQWDERRVVNAIETKLARKVRRRGTVYPYGSYCPLAWSPGPEEVLRERAVYMAWHAVLCALALALRGVLATIAVLAPGAPAAPWAGDVEAGRVADSRIFSGQRDLPYRIESRAEATQRRASGLRRSRPRHGPTIHLVRDGKAVVKRA